jgi:hypothetical protein
MNKNTTHSDSAAEWYKHTYKIHSNKLFTFPFGLPIFDSLLIGFQKGVVKKSMAVGHIRPKKILEK